MTGRQTPEVLLARDEIVAAPQQRACGDQSFELPPVIYRAMAFLFAAFVGVLGLAFPERMGVSYGVIFAFLVAFFAIPAIFVGAATGNSRTIRWSEFMSKGIETATGRASGGSATVLILMLPVLVLCFAIAVVTIAAVV